MVLKNLKNKEIILASQSPRRKELLAGIGLKFKVIVNKTIDESFDESMNFELVAEYLARKKASNYRDLIKNNTIIITADTIVCTDAEILNKPKNHDDAKRMLKVLSGKKHKVISGVCIKSIDKEINFSSETIVYFSELTKAEIEHYISTYKPYDKAGAYGIQEWIGYIGINKIEGSYFNVMGLPIHLIYNELKLF